MLEPQMTPTVMELLLRACLLLLAALTFVDGSETKLIVREDEDAILPCSLGDADISSRLFDWKKDGRVEVFIYDDGRYYGKGLSGQHEQFRGRVFHFPEQLKGGNASIVIRKSKPADSGTYACIFPHEQPERRAHVELIVDPVLKDRSEENIPGASPRPIVTLIKTNDGMLLRCEVQGASPKPEVIWKDSSGNILPSEEPQFSESQVKKKSYDIVLQTTVTKTDNYTCVSTQRDIYHQILTETYVPIPKGAAPKPAIAVKETKDGLLLQCEVYGASPKPEVVFQDSSGNILAAEPQVTERGGSYDVILETTVTKSGDYQCVATQKEINHQRSTEIHVPSGDSTPWIVVGVLVVVLVFVAVGAAWFHIKKKKTWRKDKEELQQRKKEKEELQQELEELKKKQEEEKKQPESSEMKEEEERTCSNVCF